MDGFGKEDALEIETHDSRYTVRHSKTQRFVVFSSPPSQPVSQQLEIRTKNGEGVPKNRGSSKGTLVH